MVPTSINMSNADLDHDDEDKYEDVTLPDHFTTGLNETEALNSSREEEEQSPKLGCWSAFDFFVKHSLRDVKRRKCHFCLAFCSVFVAVLATVVVNTVISKGPLIFLA